MINKFLITIFALTIFIPTFPNISYANKNNLSNQLVEIDENINEVNKKDLKKLKTINMERLLFGKATIGFYEDGSIFEAIYSSNTSGKKAEYTALLNQNEIFKGVYKIAQSKICYLLDGAEDWQCAILYKHKKIDGIYYWAQKNKIFAKIVKVIEIPTYEKMKFDQVAAEKSILEKNKEQTSNINEKKELSDFNIDALKRINFTTQDLSFLTEHPNSHYFYICGAGNLNIFGGSSSCGGSYAQEYKNLILTLRKVTGIKNINEEIYENLNYLNSKQLQITKHTNDEYNVGLSNLKSMLIALKRACIEYEEYFDQIPKKCFGFDDTIPKIALEIQNTLEDYKNIFEQLNLNISSVNNFDKSSQNLLSTIYKYKAQIDSIYKEINNPIKEILDKKRLFEEKKLAEEKRIADAKAAEEKRIAEEKEKEEKKRIAKEKKIAEAKRKEEQRIKEEERIASLQTNFGYQDIKFGMSKRDIINLKVCDDEDYILDDWWWHTCYDKKNWQFTFFSNKNKKLSKILIDLGPYTGEHLSRIRSALSKKYALDYDPCPEEELIDWIYGCGGREMELFNEGEKNSFSIVYRKGSIVLSIYRTYDNDLRIRLYYFDKVNAKKMLKELKPQDTISSDDF